MEPEGGFEPPAYRLQIGCAAVAPLGPGEVPLLRPFRIGLELAVTKRGPRLRGSL